MAKELRLIVLASGRGSNLQAIIDAIRQKKLQSKIVRVIVNVAGIQAIARAQKENIPTTVIESRQIPRGEFFAKLATACLQENPDLIVLAGFMKILPPEFIKTFQGKIINIHPALLPNFPGLHAQEQALKAGVEQTGCTVHYVDEGCDTGPVILQKIEPILPHDTVTSLSNRLLTKEHAALVEAIGLIESDKVVLQGSKTLLRI